MCQSDFLHRCLQRSQPGRLPETSMPTIQNSVNVADLTWDPFDTHRLAVGEWRKHPYVQDSLWKWVCPKKSVSLSVSAVAGDDAKIRVWQVPEGGLKEILTEPEVVLQGRTPTRTQTESLHSHYQQWSESLVDKQPLWSFTGHTEKIYSIKFHPLASGLLVSSSYDFTVRLWDLECGEEVKVLKGHEDQVSRSRARHYMHFLPFQWPNVSHFCWMVRFLD